MSKCVKKLTGATKRPSRYSGQLGRQFLVQLPCEATTRIAPDLILARD